MKMKEVIVHPTSDLRTEIQEIPVPVPGPDEIVVKVIVAGSNPKDWKHLMQSNKSSNSGDDLAGLVYSLGSKVRKTNEFKIGDRVAAFHPMGTPGGAFAEYAVAPQHTVFKIPEGTSFEEAATLPLVITTAALSLFRHQYLPPPWSPRTSSSEPTPLIIYGASGAVGSFAVKLARIANIHPIIAIAGSSSAHIVPLLDEAKGDALIDYRIGVEKMKQLVKEKLKGLKCYHAYDTISEDETWIPVSHMLSPSTETQTSYLSVISGTLQYDSPEIQKGVVVRYTYVGTAHTGVNRHGLINNQRSDAEHVEGDIEWTFVFYKYITRMLAEGRLTGHPFETIEGGLESVGKGLNMLKDGKAKGNKFLFRISRQ